MTTLQPREPYSKEELDSLYPKELQLQLVQILLRHGERSPVSPRFQNTGLKPFWPYCNHARSLSSVIMSTTDWSQFSELKYRRRLETFGIDDGPVIAAGPKGEFDAVCLPGELTDQGRESTLRLGERLRRLYVDQLGFMPNLIADADMIYLRATPLPRALESVQQTFWGLYPPSSRTMNFPPPTILTRTPADETLFPNDGNCRRFAQLSRAWANRTAERWNDTEDMKYLSKMLSRYMPGKSDVAVDAKPRLSGVMDTLNATLAHGPETRLPKEFYDLRVREIIDKIGVEEWYSGYTESREYRMLGIGGLACDIVSRMTSSVEHTGGDGLIEIGGKDGNLGKGRGGESAIRFALSGCHDTTLAGFLSSLGAFQGENWPPYTSHVAIELFRKKSEAPSSPSLGTPRTSATDSSLKQQAPSRSWLQSLFGGRNNDGPATAISPSTRSASAPVPNGIARKPLSELSEKERRQLDGYYVRLRYNDKVMKVPGCKAPGKHLEGDDSFCNLETFKDIVDQYTPSCWKQSCASNLDKPEFPAKLEPSGYPGTS